MYVRAVVTSVVGPVSTRPHFEATTMNLAAHPADQLTATWLQLTELEIDGCKKQCYVVVVVVVVIVVTYSHATSKYLMKFTQASALIEFALHLSKLH